MTTQEIPFERVYDLFAIRIILDLPPDMEKPGCWQVYSIVTDYYQPNPDRLRDWVSTPKSNGYESLHTTVMSKTGTWVEVQIRTTRMDEIAEKATLRTGSTKKVINLLQNQASRPGSVVYEKSWSMTMPLPLNLWMTSSTAFSMPEIS